MGISLGYDSPLEAAFKQGKLKTGDLFMFTTNNSGEFGRPPAIIAEFESLDEQDFGGTAFSFYVRRYMELQAPTKLTNRLPIPNITVYQDYSSYGVGIEKEVFIGSRAIVKGLRKNKNLKPYAAWFNQFRF